MWVISVAIRIDGGMILKIKTLATCVLVFAASLPHVSARGQAGDLAGLLEREAQPAAAAGPGPAGIGPDSAPAIDQRLPVPSVGRIADMTKTVAAIYEPRASAARTPTDRSALAQEMFGASAALQEAAERYSLMSAALKVAGKGDDVELIHRIAGAMAAEFVVNDLALMAVILPTVSPPAEGEKWPANADLLVATARRCIDSDRYDDATAVVTAFASLSKRLKDAKASALSAGLRRQIAERKKANDKLVQLAAAIKKGEAKPADFTEAGMLLCFDRADWDRGLPVLAKGDNQALSQLAKHDITTASADKRLEVAAAWAAYGGKPAGPGRAGSLDRAAAIYIELIPQLQGLAKVKAETALDGVLQTMNRGGRDPNAWIVVFRSASPDVWNTDNSRDARNYAIPLASLPPNVKFLRVRRANGDAVIVGVTKDALAVEIDGDNVGWNGSNKDMFGARALGVVDRHAKVDGKTGEVAISRQGGYSSGWGFGHRVGHGGASELCWNSQWIPREVLEIAVLARPLTPDEKRQLVE